MKQALYFLGLTLGLFCSAALAGVDTWYGGGSYDGYDDNSDLGGIGCPQVNNASGATNVTPAVAWLNGTLLATGGAPVTIYAYWGTNDAVTNKGSWGTSTNFGVINLTTNQFTALTTNVSVSSNQTYYYRFYATNAAGEEGWASASASFLTPAAPVLTTGSGAAPVSYTTATLHGNLTAGATANVDVYWGQNTNEWSGTNSLGSQSVGVFQTAVSSLTAGTSYYYRCYGSNGYGTGWSEIAAFTTRVDCAAEFYGGSYDGYDRYDSQTPMRLLVAGTIVSFH